MYSGSAAYHESFTPGSDYIDRNLSNELGSQSPDASPRSAGNISGLQSPDLSHNTSSSISGALDHRNKSGQSVLHISAQMCMVDGLSLLVSICLSMISLVDLCNIYVAAKYRRRPKRNRQ
jgi:hypothetical protein